jgi:hypothetical protein
MVDGGSPVTTIPVARGLILCESSWEDDLTGRLTLTDCFTDLTVRSFPSVPRTFWAAAFLSDGFGDLRVRIEIVDPDRGRMVHAHEQGIGLRGRLAVYPFRYQVSGCAFPEPGMYEAVLYVEGELVAATSFLVRQEEPDDE